jgi:hypothetical protein
MENTTVKQMFTTTLGDSWRVWSSPDDCSFCCVAQLRLDLNFGGFRF